MPAPHDQLAPPLFESVTDEELQHAMASLSPKQRQVFEAISQGKRYAEVASELGIREGAVAKRLFDARKRLRKVLKAVVARRKH